jgi:hypothetical protein
MMRFRKLEHQVWLPLALQQQIRMTHQTQSPLVQIQSHQGLELLGLIRRLVLQVLGLIQSRWEQHQNHLVLGRQSSLLEQVLEDHQRLWQARSLLRPVLECCQK